MDFIKLIKHTNKLVKNDLIITQPLFIFLFILILVLSPLAQASAITGGGMLLLTLLALTAAFVSGWFNMFHKCVSNYSKLKCEDSEKATNSLGLFKEFFPGVGKYFYKIVLGYLLYAILFIIFFEIIGVIGALTIGIPETFNPEDFQNTTMTQEQLMELFNQIPEDIRQKWYLLLFGSVFAYFYVLSFWAHAIIVDKKGVLASFLSSLKLTLTKPLLPFLIVSSFFLCMFILNLINLILPLNVFTWVINMFLSIYIIVYFIMMSFVYYEEYK